MASITLKARIRRIRKLEQEVEQLKRDELKRVPMRELVASIKGDLRKQLQKKSK